MLLGLRGRRAPDQDGLFRTVPELHVGMAEVVDCSAHCQIRVGWSFSQWQRLRCKFVRGGKELEVVVKVQLDEKVDKTLVNEWVALARLPRHKNVLHTLGVCEDFEQYVENWDVHAPPPRVALVTAFMANGSIEDYLKKPANRDKAKLHISQWALQIANGLAHLHANRRVHRDIATRNVFLDADLECGIGDLGLLRAVGDEKGEALYKPRGEVKAQFFAAPEVLDGFRFGLPSDIWSFALTLFDIATGCRAEVVPFPSMRDADDFKAAALLAKSADSKHNYKELTDQLPDWFPDSLKSLMLSCLAKRPTAADIVFQLSGAPLPLSVSRDVGKRFVPTVGLSEEAIELELRHLLDILRIERKVEAAACERYSHRVS